MARVKKISIKNIMGIEELEFEPGGAVTVVQGGNGSGKTSVLEALRSVVQGGHDATLLRHGAESGEVVWVFDDDVEVRKRITPTTSDLTGRHPTMGRISAAQTYLRGLTDQLSVNPVEFLTAKDRAAKLLEAMPLRVELSVLQEALDGTGMEVPRLLGERHALEAIAGASKIVFDERTGENRLAKDQRTTAEQLQGSLPRGFESPTVLENQLHDSEGAHRDAERTLTQAIEAVNAETEKRIAGIREEMHRQVQALQGQIHQIEQLAQQQIEDARTAGAHTREDLMLDGRPRVNQLGAQVEQLREQLKAADRYENTKSLLDQARAKAERAQARSEALTAALERLALLRSHVAKQLPIPGVEIRDGEVYRGDVPFPRLNHAEQIKLAVEVAKLRAGDCPLVCVDGLECLDEPTFGLLVAALQESGLQVIVTRVAPDGSPLKVETAAHA